MAGSFTDLQIWQKGHELLMDIYRLTSKYPIDEKYNLISQTRNSALSVIANIAEAHGRYYFADKVRVLYTSRGEIEETRSHLRVALGLKYLSVKDFERLDVEYVGLTLGLNSYIKSLSRNHKS